MGLTIEFEHIDNALTDQELIGLIIANPQIIDSEELISYIDSDGKIDVIGNLLSLVDVDMLFDLLSDSEKLNIEAEASNLTELDISNQFDDLLEETVTGSLFEIKQYLDDSIAINEDFINYIDSLCNDGIIGQTQAHHYEYIGKYSCKDV